MCAASSHRRVAYRAGVGNQDCQKNCRPSGQISHDRSANRGRRDRSLRPLSLPSRPALALCVLVLRIPNDLISADLPAGRQCRPDRSYKWQCLVSAVHSSNASGFAVST
jgi:hypothetical protein